MPQLNIDPQAAAQLNELLTLPLRELNTKWQDADFRLDRHAATLRILHPMVDPNTDPGYITIKREARLLELAIGIVSAAEAHDHPRECKHANCGDWCDDPTKGHYLDDGTFVDHV